MRGSGNARSETTGSTRSSDAAGMGTVYAGEHVYIKWPVAVKILHPQFAKYQEAIHRFLRWRSARRDLDQPREHRRRHRLRHPRRRAGLLLRDGVPRGQEPRGSDREGRRVELHRALNIANQIALALEAAHNVGVIHRDLKPDNIHVPGQRPGRRDLARTTPDQQWDRRARRTYDFVKVSISASRR